MIGATIEPNRPVFRRRPLDAAAAALILLLVALPLAAQQPDEPALEPDAIAGLAIVITDVQGMAQVRAGEDEPWERAEPGMMLAAGAEFRTGPRSAVRFRVGDTQTVTLDRLGTATVLEAIAEAGRATTDVGMQYGRTIFEIEAAEELEHDSRIRSPSATLSVRGSRGFLEEYRRKVLGGADRGDVAWTNVRGRFVQLPPGARQENEQTSTAENRLDEGAFRPDALANEPVENQLLAELPSGVLQAREQDFAAFRGQEIGAAQMPDLIEPPVNGLPPGNGEPSVPLVGVLNFIVDWTGPADLDMYVISPLNEGLSVFPSGGIPGFEGTPMREVPSGGKVERDDTIANGVEQAFWDEGFPGGVYIVGTRVFSAGGGSTIANIDAFLDGQRLIPTFVSEPLTSSGQFVQTEVNVPAPD